MRHYDVLHGAESQVAVSEAFERMSIEDRRGCTRILNDWREVSSASLQDTDRAMASRSELKIARLVGPSESDVKSLLRAIDMIFVVDSDNPCSPILLERLKRRSVAPFRSSVVVSDMAKGLASLGLPTDLRVQYPQAPQIHGKATPQMATG